MLNNDTIVAMATPAGRAGVGIVRVSGPKALSIAERITRDTKLKPRYAHYLPCFDEKKDCLDSGIVLYFKAPHSYTGEDIVEFQMHASPFILSDLIRLCVLFGARMAEPGEFTRRAYLNDKIDLLQAEAVVDLINAQSASAAKMAARTLQGRFSDYVHTIEQELIELRMFVESTIDFSDEALEWLETHQWQTRLEHILKQIQHLRQQANQGHILQQGLKIVLAGRPNAGKSTLMNALAQKDVAIVTDIAGTTRDVMKEQVLIDDIPVTLIDTAGLRTSDDPIEQEGIRRAWLVIAEADIVLFLHDGLKPDWQTDELPEDLVQQLPANVPIISILNKSDLCRFEIDKDVLALSAKSGLGIDQLKQKIKDLLGIRLEDSEFIARRRHLLLFEGIEQQIQEAISQFKQHQAPELLAEDLRFAHESLSQMTGEFSSDDLLGEIFSSFCIGK